MNCIFCKIIANEIPCQQVYEDEHVMAFNDIAPVSPIHILIVPKAHVSSLSDTDENSVLLQHILSTVIKIAKSLDITDYRVVTNIGPLSGQTVRHLHFHLLSGRQMKEMG